MAETARREERRFRWRGGSVSRIEALSDGVFALALTLLVVTLQVPATFDELLDAFRQVPAFLLTFAMFGWIWYLHHQFHRRFGLEDTTTVTWNLVLLFVVLLYVVPLRFLASTLCQLFGLVTPRGPLPEGFVASGLRGAQMQDLMVLYAAGYMAVFASLAMLYRNAWRRRDELELDPHERALTRGAVRSLSLTFGVGAVSLVLALAGSGGTWQFLSGITYAMTGVAWSWSDRRTAAELRAAAAGSPSP